MFIFSAAASFPFTAELSVFPESFRERIIVNFELRNPVVLVGCHSEECCVREGVRVVGGEL